MSELAFWAEIVRILPFLWGIALLAWAFFSDRSRGRRRCPKCWYSMNAAPPDNALRCPECGNSAESEKHLYRTRRKWGWAAAGITMILMALSHPLVGRAALYGPGSLLPASALIMLFEFDDAPWIARGISFYILARDMDAALADDPERLWRWQWRRLGHSTLRHLEGDRATNDHNVRGRYFFWLAAVRRHCDDPPLRERITAAINRDMDHDDAQVRRLAAAFAVDPADPSGSLSRALRALDDESHAAVQSQIIRSIGSIAHTRREAVPHVLEWLAHEQAWTRQAALEAVRAAAPTGSHDHLPGVYEAVLAMKDDPSGNVREARIWTLAHLQTQAEAWQTIEATLRIESIIEPEHLAPHRSRLEALTTDNDPNPSSSGRSSGTP